MTRWPAPAGLHTASVRLPDEGEIASFGGATGWLNSPPLTPEDLRGKVAVVGFWTYTCVNWLRQLPYLRAWAGKYREHGLVVIGVHTPEFAFEKDPENVRRAVADLGIDYPVATDNDYEVWRAFGNHYWPALYFADVRGIIRHHHFGEGEYQQSEMIIQRLLSETGSGAVSQDLVTPETRGPEAAADWADLRSAETYLGSGRTENFASPGGLRPETPHDYSAPAGLARNQWALTGNWTVADQPARLNSATGQIVCRFHARDLNLVMGPADRGTAVRFQVLIDGEPPGADHGEDVDDQGIGTLSEQRLHQLIRQQRPVTDRTFEIAFLDPGAEAFVFTFG
jgi:thiol-disulfide isomerase/thioredoxin